MGNRKFVENSLKTAFIRRLERLGIDPQTVDLSIYDFHSFETIDDLLRFYAKHGDPIAARLVSYSTYDNSKYDDIMAQYAHEYKNYLESLEAEDPEKRLEKLEADLDGLYKRIISIESKITPLDLRAITEELQNIKSELMAIKSTGHNPQPYADMTIIQEIKKDLEDKIERLRAKIEELAPKPEKQLTLTAFSETAEDIPLIELDQETALESRSEKRPSRVKATRRRSSGVGPLMLRVIIVHIMGLIISYIIADLGGPSMFLTFLIFLAMAWADALVWSSRSGPSRRGFATGYMMSQYTNPYKAGRGR